MRLPNVFLLFAGSVITTVTIGLIPAGVAGATGACSRTTPGNYFDGRANYGTSAVQGVSALIWVRDGVLCTGAPNGFFYAGWSMITGYGGQGYAQSGFVYFKGTNSYDVEFAQDDKCNACTPESHFTTTRDYPGQAYTFSSFLNPYGYWVMYEGGNFLLNSSFQYTAWTAPFGVQYFGEVSDNGGSCQATCGDDQPGTASAQMGETDLAVFKNGSWTNSIPTLASGDDNATRWSFTAVTNCLDGKPCFSIFTSTP